MEQFTKYKDVDFANDDQFIDWVINPDNEKDSYWQRVKKAYPYLVKEINLARKIVLGLYPHEEQIQKETIDNIWLKVQKDRKKNNNYFLYAAAVLFISLLVGGGVIFQNYQKSNSYLAVEENLNEQSILYSNNQSPIIFEDAVASLDYSNSEGIILNKDSILIIDHANLKGGTQMEKIVVPYGKRLCLTLPDKTQVWINSGSQLVFPKKFKKSKREVYLVGEAFFKVTHEETQTFIVHTINSTVKVLGTKFNIKAYSDDQREETVLVSGKVSMSKSNSKDKPAILKPGQMSTLSKKNNTLKIKEVDTNLFTSWINGYIIFKNETTGEIMRQISRYYNKEIIVDKDANHISFSGKLDLTQDFEVVMNRISKTSSLRYFYKGEQIMIKL